MWEGNHFQVIRDKGCGNREDFWGKVTSPDNLPAPVLLICLSAQDTIVFSSPCSCLLLPRPSSLSLHVDIDSQHVPFALGLVIDLVTKQMGLELLMLPALFLRIYLTWKGRQDSQFCPITRPLVQPCRVTSARDKNNAQSWTLSQALGQSSVEGSLAKNPVGSQEELIDRGKPQYHFQSFLALSNPTEVMIMKHIFNIFLNPVIKFTYLIYLFFLINYNIHAPNSVDHELSAPH